MLFSIVGRRNQYLWNFVYLLVFKAVFNTAKNLNYEILLKLIEAFFFLMPHFLGTLYYITLRNNQHMILTWSVLCEKSQIEKVTYYIIV